MSRLGQLLGFREFRRRRAALRPAPESQLQPLAFSSGSRESGPPQPAIQLHFLDGSSVLVDPHTDTAHAMHTLAFRLRTPG